jgi:hypothetical protein
LSEFVIRKIKDGTYHVTPEKNKFADRRPGEQYKRKRKRTSLPGDYKADKVASFATYKQLRKEHQAAANQASLRHQYPDAKKLLEEHFNYDSDSQVAEPDLSLRVELYPETEAPTNVAWFEAHLDPDDFDLIQEFLYEEENPPAPSRRIQRAKQQLASWHQEEQLGGTPLKLLKQDETERTIELTESGLEASRRAQKVVGGHITTLELFEAACRPVESPMVLNLQIPEEIASDIRHLVRQVVAPIND